MQGNSLLFCTARLEGRLIMSKVFTDTETLAQINEKARLHGLSYGYYVLARMEGKFKEDALHDIKMNHEKRYAFCKTRKRARG